MILDRLRNRYHCSNHRGNVYRIDGPLIDDVPSSYFVDWNSSKVMKQLLLIQIMNYDDTLMKIQAIL